ncbi:MAG: hypothetical protein A2Y07_09045 [Planctomycetes bacterium GWF2_50_10]|nr:MAG: hypothetical protein A2Y07_09045 [Planctomycetes bacterium GWF2_50_10]
MNGKTHKKILTSLLILLANCASGWADVVLNWNYTALNAVKTAQYTSVAASRAMAMVHVAMYDSLMAIDKNYQPFHVTTASAPGASREAAISSAAHRVLVSLFPAQAMSFDMALADELAQIPDSQSKTDGIALGQSVADAIIAWRAGDHSSDVVPYNPPVGPGYWVPTPPMNMPAMNPQWAIVTPFALVSNSQFRPGQPPALTSAEYTAAFNEVKSIGSKTSATRSQMQSMTAMFWMDMPGTWTTVGRWNFIARQTAMRHHSNLWQNARLFAMFNVALADAGIQAWDIKYAYSFWRPITAITQANTDNNPATIEDTAWEPYITTPAFPEYVSAHSTFSGAAAQILADFFNDDNISFTVTSYTDPNMLRVYRSFTQAADEAGISRIYGGIHFSFSNRLGLDAGRSVAKYVLHNYMQPTVPLLDTDPNDTDGDGDLYNDVIYKRMGAGDGFVNMADGKLQYIFGFNELTGVPEDMIMHYGMTAAEFPAPTIRVKEGQTLHLDLTNVGMPMRPDLFDPHSIHWHGFSNAAPVFDGVPESSITINMGGTLRYYYNVVEPGTYMWHCHVEATEHMQMGMLGALAVLPKQNNLPNDANLNGFTHHKGYKYAYNDGDGSTYYDIDYSLQMHSFDPNFHDLHIGVQPLPFAMMKDKYAMFNGRGYPQTIDSNSFANTENGVVSSKIPSLISAIKGERILLRVSSLSTTDYFTMRVLGIPMKVIGAGARQLRGPDGKDLSYYTSSLTLGGGETYDVMLDTRNVPAGVYPVYTTNLNFLSNDKEDYGGMMTEIIVADGAAGIPSIPDGSGGGGGGGHTGH